MPLLCTIYENAFSTDEMDDIEEHLGLMSIFFLAVPFGSGLISHP